MSNENHNNISSARKKVHNFLNLLKLFFIGVQRSIKRIFNQVGAISLTFFRSPSLIFWTFILPIILVLLFGSIFGRSVPINYQLPVLDLDNSSESIDFQHFLNTSTTLNLEIVDETLLDPIEWCKENNKIIILVVPQSWGAKINNSIETALTVYHDPSSASANAILKILEEAVSVFNFQILTLQETIGVEIDNFYLGELNFIDSFVPGIIMIIISVTTLITGLTLDLEEKHSGMFKKFPTTPIFKFEWIFAKQIWQIILAIIASTLAVLFALIFNFNIYTLHPTMLLFIIYGTLTFSGIAMILVRLIRNPEGVMLVSVLFTIPQIFLSGALIPLDTLPQFLRVIARIFPLYYLTEGMRYLMLDFTQQQFWLNFIISTSFTIGVFTIGIILTRWKND
ncbi:MAG: ABC transporter permease [Candidatus Thorarchaeota archaeon]